MRGGGAPTARGSYPLNKNETLKRKLESGYLLCQMKLSVLKSGRLEKGGQSGLAVIKAAIKPPEDDDFGDTDTHEMLGLWRGAWARKEIARGFGLERLGP